MATPSAVARVVLLLCATTGLASRHHIKFLNHEKASPVNHTGIALPTMLANLGDQCKCVFKGSCTCEAAVEFMNCITNACSSGKCACTGDLYFVSACDSMSDVCPNVALQCTKNGATCMGDNRTLKNAVSVPPVESKPQALDITGGLSNGTLTVESPVEVGNAAADAYMQAADGTDKVLYRGEYFVAHVVIVFLFAYLYDKYRYTKLAFPQQPGRIGTGDFAYHLCGCFEDWKMSLISCCCWQLRWSDTIDKANLCKYWYAVVVFIILSSFYGAMAVPITGLLLVVIMTYYRQQLRKSFGFSKVGGCSVGEDFCTYFWCSCCAIVQEARQVEAAGGLGRCVQFSVAAPQVRLT